MIPDKAYELARSAGWSPIVFVSDGSMIPKDAPWQVHAFDPAFFQALGKALGWEKKMVVRIGTVIGNFVGGEKFVGEEMGFGMDYFNPEIYYAYRFYDLILTGGDTEAFWQSLLTSKE